MDTPAQTEEQNAEENRPVTFTHNIFVKLVGLGCVLLFGFFSAVSFFNLWEKEIDGVTAIVFPAFAILGLVLFLWMNQWWTVRADGIAVRSWYGREETHSWTDLDSAVSTGLGSGLRIKDTFGKTVLSLDPWIWRYGEFVELLRLHKPELFEQKIEELPARDIRVLKRNPAVYFIGLLFSALFAAPGILSLLQGDWLGVALLVIGGAVVYFMLRIPYAVQILEDRLRFRYLLTERTVPITDIYNVYARTTQDLQGGAGASAVVELTGGRKIELAGFRDGTPTVVNALRNWCEAYWKAHPQEEDEGGAEEEENGRDENG
jgi:hypothetical protein